MKRSWRDSVDSDDLPEDGKRMCCPSDMHQKPGVRMEPPPNHSQPFDFSQTLRLKSRLEHLQALQVLCQRSILANLRHFYSLKEAPFAVLPWNIIGDLVRYVAEKAPHVLTNPNLLHLFVTEQTSIMSADFQQCRGNTEAVQRFMVSQLEQNSPNLTTLDLRMKDYSRCSTTLVSQEDPQVMHGLVNNLLSQLTNLEELQLNCYVENRTLGIVGRTCPRLKRLNVSGNRGVTNQGVFLLCPGSTADAGRCAAIEQLDVTNTGVGIMGGVHALAALPKLKVLRHNSSYSVLKAFKERHKNRTLPSIQSLHIAELPFRARFATSDHLRQVCGLVPSVRSLSLSRVPDVSPLLKLKAVSNLELLHFNSVNVVSEVELMLSAFSLTRLSITGQHSLDLDLVALRCPLLQHLQLQCPLDIGTKANRNHFRKLETLDLRPVELQELPLAPLEAALTSPCLHRIALTNVVLPVKLMHRLLDEAEAGKVVYAHLLTVKLEHVGVESFLDKETLLLRFVAVSPTLREVCMNNNKYPCTTEKEIQLLRLFARIHRGETLRLRSSNKKLNFIS
ncbi:uncharacterized protein LOC135946508 isoform X1 [Cloeon dipterum]|uniref:uncharacterized protein LOC135946508 isoform X1 n=1 Tax=Cloeon dipterum TaxID=197152 RepID=UPI0032206BA2